MRERKEREKKKKKERERKKREPLTSTMKHASTAPATNKSRRTPLCRCEVLQIIIKPIGYLQELTAWKRKNAEIILDHRIRLGLRFPWVWLEYESWQREQVFRLRLGIDTDRNQPLPCRCWLPRLGPAADPAMRVGSTPYVQLVYTN